MLLPLLLLLVDDDDEEEEEEITPNDESKERLALPLGCCC